MRGGGIYSKQADFITDLIASLKKNGIEYIGEDGADSLRIISNDDRYILIYGRTGPGDELYDGEMPDNVRKQGYIYYWLADCRSEEFFVEIFGNPNLGVDMLLWDNDGAVYRPDQLDAKTLKL